MKRTTVLALVVTAAAALASASPLDGFLGVVDAMRTDPGLSRSEKRALTDARDLLRRRGLLSSEVQWTTQAAQRLTGRSTRTPSPQTDFEEFVRGALRGRRGGSPSAPSAPGPFARDPEILAAQSAAADELLAALQADRDVLHGYLGTLGDAAAEQRLVSGIAAADRDLFRVRNVKGTLARLRVLASAAKHLRDAYPPQPDFVLEDANTASASWGGTVSPRAFTGYTSAWYFSHAT